MRQIKSRRMRWVGYVACTGEERKLYQLLVRKPEGKRLLERPRHTWKDGIRIDLKEIGWGDVGLIHLAQGRDWLQALVNAVMKLPVLAPWSQ
jgi:hypothetical protein